MDMPASVPVFVVDDDDDDIRESARLVLEADGYPVADVGTVEEALAYLRAAEARHVVLLDYLLSREDGKAVLRAIEGDAALRRHCYVLFTVAQVNRLPADEQRRIGALCTEVLNKPFDIDELLRAVERAAALEPVNS